MSDTPEIRLCPETGRPCDPYECGMLSPECKAAFELSAMAELLDPYDELFELLN